MRRNIYFILVTLSSIFIVYTSSAQTCPDFTIHTEVTPSNCTANGTITVTLEGDIENLESIRYALESTISDGYNVPPQPLSTFNGIPPGKYSIRITAICNLDNKTINRLFTDIIIEGDYEVPSGEFISGASRKSYAHCPTGIIALEVKKGSGDYTFEILEAPEGVDLGLISVVKNENIYTLIGDKYPAGSYTIQVSDACNYKKNIKFNLQAITGYPAFSYHYTSFSQIPPYESCSILEWSLIKSSNPITNGDYLRYYKEGMYELSISVGDDAPINWKEWEVNDDVEKKMIFDIFPRQFSDAYENNSLKLNIRVKGCADYKTFSSNLVHFDPVKMALKESDCNGYVYEIMANMLYKYNAIYCFPYSIVIKEGEDIIKTISGIKAEDKVYTPSLEYNKSYNYTIYDANDLVIHNGTFSHILAPATHRIVNKCNGYNFRVTPPNLCFPLNVTIVKKSDFTTVYEGVFASYASLPSNGIDLEYNEEYTLNAVAEASPQFNFNYDFRVTKPIYQLLTYVDPTNSCEENQGHLRLSVYSNFITSYGGYPGSFIKHIAQSTFKVLDSSPMTSYTGEIFKITGEYNNLPPTTLPAGEYFVEVKDGCGEPQIVSAIYAGGYDASDFDYATEKIECNGLRLLPFGKLKVQGEAINTYYRLTSGPAGYDKNTVITTGGAFILNQKGSYKIGIMRKKGSNECFFRELEVNYNPLPLELDSYKTAAYVCDGESIGNIMIAAKNGEPPYKYQLWNTSGTVQLTEEIISDGEAHFNYGNANSTYIVKVIDNCNNSFTQAVDMIDLATAGIAYSPDEYVCEGGTIQLNCVSLGATEYNWTGPNGWSVLNTQNPLITNAKENMTGWYKVSVKPQFCNNSMFDSVYITVRSSLPLVNVKSEIGYCQGQNSESLVESSGAVASEGHTLIWYGDDKVSIITPPSLINTSIVGETIYYVSQIDNTTSCESEKIKITVTIYSSLEAPIIGNTLEPMCPGDDFVIIIDSPILGHIYSIYDQEIGGNLISQVIGNTDPLSIACNAPEASTIYYVEVNNEGGGCASKRTPVAIEVKKVAQEIDVITTDALICPNTSTNLVVSTSTVSDPIYKWYYTQTEELPFHSGNSYTTPSLEFTTTYYIGVAGSDFCENPINKRKPVTVTIREFLSVYPDIRVVSCAEQQINLNKYIDIFDLQSIKWTPASEFNNGGENDGSIINPERLMRGNTYTYQYLVTNSCITSGSKFFLKIIDLDERINLEKVVRVCFNTSSNLQLNQILGIDADGTWTCSPASAEPYLTVDTRPQYSGLTVFDGEKAWNDPNVLFDLNGDKEITFIYTPSETSCLKDKQYILKLILTSDMLAY